MARGGTRPQAGCEQDRSGSGELVVLLDEDRRPVGTMAKEVVHTATTPLHLAFSCYVFDEQDRLLVTRRALSKRTWPGVWTNSCCGHPGPGEDVADAVRRRLADELGMEVERPQLVLPDFAYTATAADGLVENEVCPVYVARALGQPQADPDEVAEWRWVPWDSYVGLAAAAPWAVSPWSALQVGELSGLAPHPAAALSAAPAGRRG